MLSKDEQITITNNLQQKLKIPCTSDDIWETWHLVYRRHSFKMALKNAKEKSKQFYIYQTLKHDQAHVSVFLLILYLPNVSSKNLLIYIHNKCRWNSVK